MDAVPSDAARARGRSPFATPPDRAAWRATPLWIVEIPMAACPRTGRRNGRQICAVRARSDREALHEALRRTHDPAAVARRRGAALDPGRATVTAWDSRQSLL
ncbi:hypothetical protein [Kitasatospora sp. NPDC047058]|uniref:hypothetical protein n=1 Tax=Kitasatospora sp. NPDC047058 TaxID=3155620 RepID=UPI0033E0BA86